MINNKLLIDNLITIDDTGMPKPPNTRQLLDKDIRELYRRDTSKDKHKYLAECIVIYYLGDPKSPAKQNGLSNAEALKMAIEQAGLPKNYAPDALVLRLIKRYYDQNITEAGKVVENLMKGIHNVNLVINRCDELLNEKLKTETTMDNIQSIVNLIDIVNKKSGEIPTLLDALKKAKENLMYEKETELSRGGQQVLSSMDAEEA